MFLHKARYVGVYSIYLLAVLLSTTSQAENNNLSTRIELESAVNTNNSDLQKIELLIQPELEINLSDETRVTSILQIWSDAKDNISPGDHSQTELRELYLDTSINDGFIRVGKQQVVWGKSDGLKVLDIVNPQDFREFILDDFDRSRLPLWTLNAEIQIDDKTLQLLLIPDQTYHEFAEPGGSYAFTSPLVIPTMLANANVVKNPTKTPGGILQDADFGFRLSTFTHGWDLSLNYLYHYDDSPVLFRTISPTPAGLDITINPEYRRTHLIGGTLTKTFGNLTLRGEMGYLTNKYINTNNPLDKNGVVKTGQLKTVFGFDWYGFSDTLLSAQVFQTRLDRFETGMINDEINTQITLLVKQSYMNETLHAELIYLLDIDNEDGMVRSKLTYEYSDEINLFAGFDIFFGRKSGLFGQFKDTDRFVAGIVAGF